MMNLLRKIKADDLLRHSVLLFTSMVFVHASNVAFQMVVGRKLPKEEFALLAAFLAALTIIQRPLATLRAATCHYGSLLVQEGRHGDVKRLLKKWLILTSVPSLLAGLLTILFSDSLSELFHLNRPAPVIIAGALLPALCWLPILNGASQGLQLFRWTSSSAIVGALTRLVLGGGFTVVLYQACGWAMLGHGISIYVTIFVIFLGLWFALHGGQTSSEPLPSMRLYLLHSFFTLAAFAVLMTADVVLIKHYVPEDAEFSFAATLGRMVSFLPGAIVMSMFPKVASAGALTRKQRSIFFRSFGYTMLCVTFAILVCALVPDLLKRVLFGHKVFSEGFNLMMLSMSGVMGLSALLNVNVQFLLAQRRFKACMATVVCAGLYLGTVHFFHDTTWQIVAVSGACNGLALLIGMVSVYRLKTED